MTMILFFIWGVVAIVAGVVAGWMFRWLLTRCTSGNVKTAIRHAPVSASFGMLIILIYIAIAVVAPLIAPFPEREVVGDQFMPWSASNLLGTDNLGRDMFTRLIYGARNTVGIAFAVTTIAFVIGSTFGLLAATVGGWIDQMASRLVDVMMAIPALVFSLLLLTILGTSVTSLVLVISIIDSTRVFRVARAVAQTIVTKDFIEAARLRGENLFRLVFREVLPNALAPLVAEFGLRFCFVFLSISALSFLGVGIQPPMADWGSMVRDNAALITFGDLTPLLPAGAIALLAVAVNFVVDWFLHLASGLKE